MVIMNGNESSLMNLRGRRGLVTGSSGGMGRAIAVALAGAGVDLALVGRNQDKTTETVNACIEKGVRAIPIICDISRMDQLEVLVQKVVEELSGLDFLVNCAGSHVVGKAYEVDLKTWDNELDINFRAPYHLARFALPEIIKNPGGAVINIGSITVPYRGGGMAAASKRALGGYAEALFEDVREYGIKVCTIHPGFVNTPMVHSDRLDPARMIQPDDIARTVLFVLSMPETACPTEITIRPQRSPYFSKSGDG